MGIRKKVLLLDPTPGGLLGDAVKEYLELTALLELHLIRSSVAGLGLDLAEFDALVLLSGREAGPSWFSLRERARGVGIPTVLWTTNPRKYRSLADHCLFKGSSIVELIELIQRIIVGEVSEE